MELNWYSSKEMRITIVSVLIFYLSFSSCLFCQESNLNFDILQERLVKYVDHYKSENPNDLKDLKSFVEDFVATAPDSSTARSLIEETIMGAVAARDKGLSKVSNKSLLGLLRLNIKGVLKGTKHHKKLTKDHVKLIRRNKEVLGLYSSHIINSESSILTPLFKEELEFYDLVEGDILADIGAGLGTTALVFSFLPIDIEIHCTEINKDLNNYQEQLFLNLPQDSRYSNVQVEKGSKTSTELQKNHFSKILLRNTFHHFSEIPEMLQSIHSTLTSEGRLYITEDFRVQDETPYCYKMTTEEEFLTNMEGHGFKLEDRTDIGPSTLFKYRKVSK